MVRAQESKPDIALVDIELGDADGLEVAERLASLEDPPAVVLVSGGRRERYAERISGSSAIGFISKIDLSANTVERTVRAARRRPQM